MEAEAGKTRRSVSSVRNLQETPCFFSVDNTRNSVPQRDSPQGVPEYHCNLHSRGGNLAEENRSSNPSYFFSAPLFDPLPCAPKLAGRGQVPRAAAARKKLQAAGRTRANGTRCPGSAEVCAVTGQARWNHHQSHWIKFRRQVHDRFADSCFRRAGRCAV